MRVTLCGSPKFEKDFKAMNKRLSLAGHTVYTLSCYPSDEGGKDWYSQDEKTVLDRVHLNKIDNSDAIVVIDRDYYIGESTKAEIDYAIKNGKRIFYFMGSFSICPHAGCRDPLQGRPCALCYE